MKGDGGDHILRDLSLSLSLSLVLSSKELKRVCDDGCKIGKLGL